MKKRKEVGGIWPIDEAAGTPPEGWCGWPEERRFAFILTHDVETGIGQERCLELMNMEKELGFRSSFNFVPERYIVSPEVRSALAENGFEVGVHGLLHDGKLYASKKTFTKRAMEINRYLAEWGSAGFRSPAMHHNLDWLHDLDIQYDASTFDTDPFQPQPDGANTIFPFWVEAPAAHGGYVELPYTLPQDFEVFVLMKESGPAIWKEKLDWIARKGGMALLVSHPDYVNCSGNACKLEEYPIDFYEEFLRYAKQKYDGQYWHALPREVARFWAKINPERKG